METAFDIYLFVEFYITCFNGRFMNTMLDEKARQISKTKTKQHSSITLISVKANSYKFKHFPTDD
jgi:hypothetical protein